MVNSIMTRNESLATRASLLQRLKNLDDQSSWNEFHELYHDLIFSVARRAGLVHDIGKAIDREMDGTHLQIGIDLLRKFGESEEVVHAMACHHGDYDPQTVEAVLVTAAGCYACKLAGLTVPRRVLSNPRVRRFAELVPVALLSDLIADRPYVVTHGSFRPFYKRRRDAMDAALDRMEAS